MKTSRGATVCLRALAGAVALSVLVFPGCNQKRQAVEASVVAPHVEGPRLFVSNERSGTISVIDTATDRVVHTINVGARPRGVTYNPSSRMLFAALSDLPPKGGKIAPGRRGIAAIDPESGGIRKMYDGGTDPETLAASHDGKELFISNEDAGTATIVDTATAKTLATLVVGIEPEGVAISPDGRWVYVTSETSSTVSVIDTKEKKVVATFMVGARPRAATFSPDGRWAMVSSEVDGSVSFIDVPSHSVASVVDLPPSCHPVGIALTRDGSTAYVADGHANSVSVIDTKSRKVVRTIPVGQRPWNLTITPDGSKLYAANGLSDDVSVIDLASQKVIRTIRVGDGPWGVAIER